METACRQSGTSAHAQETAFCDRTNGVSTEKRVGRAGDGGTERAARDAAFSPARLKQGGCRVHAGGNRAEPDAIVARNSATEPGCLALHHALVDQRTAESSSTVSEFGCNGSEPKSCHTDSSARLARKASAPALSPVSDFSLQPRTHSEPSRSDSVEWRCAAAEWRVVVCRREGLHLQ